MGGESWDRRSARVFEQRAAFTAPTAALKSEYGSTTTTGANASSTHRSHLWSQRATIVASYTWPYRLPPASTWPPLATASFTHPSMRTASLSVIRGPTKVSGCSGLPFLSSFVFSTSALTTAS